ncbi:MAG: GNAT family N-acetyltransferase [Lachnospiraceae bacterium]|nr:GNAT family N-acetyltransferase [Lachnospiraceae bacterium]
MQESYETKQLYMKRLTRADAHMVCSFYAKNAREFALYEPLTYDNACNINYHQTMLEYEEEYFKENEMCRYYLFEKNNPFETVGTVSFRNISLSYYKCATLGYKIDKDHRRRGYAEESIKRGMQIMDEELHLHRIEATVMPVNIGSMNLLEKVGFEREGLMRDKFKLNGVWEDHYLYAFIMPWNK